MYKPAEMGQLLLVLGQTKARRDVACIDRDRRRVARRISVPCVESRDECGRERKVGSLKLIVD